jgi:RNA polymerase sigma factor (sigma-70 family)
MVSERRTVTAPDRRTPRGARIPPFQRFLDEHRAAVYRFLLATVGPNDADDCFQETFLAALRAYPNLRDARNLRGWVLAIATRKAIDMARARRRRPEPVPDVAGLLSDAVAAAGLAEWPDFPAEHLDDSLWQDVLELPPRQRVALVHRVVLDRPYPELAAAMGISVEAARANVYQALKRLREGVKQREAV